MENKEKKEYLRSYQQERRAEKRLEKQIESLRYDKMHPSMVQDGMPHGSEQKDLSDYMVKLEEMLTRLERIRMQHISHYKQINDEIEEMESEQEKEVLVYRYLHNYGWKKIANTMGYSRAQVNRIHGKALVHFQPKDETP